MGGIQNIMNGSGSFSGNSGLPLGMDNTDGYLKTNATGLNFNYKPSKKAVLTSSLFLNTFGKNYDKDINRETYFTDSSLFSNERLNQESRTFNNRLNVHFKQEFNSASFFNIDASGNWTEAKYKTNTFLENLNSQYELRNEYKTISDQEKFNYSGDINADFRKKFTKKGRYTGGGVNYSIGKKSIRSALAYSTINYNTVNFIESINQNQNDLRGTMGYGFEWMYSEPILKKQLVQIKGKHKVNTESRDKKVTDELSVTDNLLNQLLSGKGSYSYTRSTAELKHKYISKKMKTTSGFSMERIELTSELFSKSRQYNYVLPFFNMNWDVNKASKFTLYYDTDVNVPTLIQLQSLPNNSNPAEIVLGNLELEPEYNHSIGVEFETFNQFNFTHFMAQVRMSQIKNKINYAQTLDTYLNKVFRPENIGNEENLNSYLSFGTNLNALKTKFSITNSSTIAKGNLKLNSELDNYVSFSTHSKLIIENIRKKVINIKTGIEGSYSKNSYENTPAFNGDFYSWNYLINMTLKGKDKWVLSINMKHYFYPGFNEANDQIIINTSIARNILESKKLQIYVSANDILNQNSGVNQAYYLNYYEKEQTATLGRYILVGMKYSFNKMGKKASK